MSLEKMQEQVERYYIEMENALLMNIAKKLSVGKPMEIDKWDLEKGAPIKGSGGVNEWQLESLKALGGLTDENAKIIANYSGKTVKEVEKVFNRAKEIGTDTDKKLLSLGIKTGVLNKVDPRTENIVVNNVIKSSIKETLTTFNKQNNSLLASAGSEYTKIVNNVTTEVLAGTKTVAKAMQESISKLAEKGLTGFTARNGAEWTPEAYTKMVVRTNVRQATNRMQEERFKLYGNDYVEISQHMGARPLCSEDQGKIFSLSGNTEPIMDGLGNKIEVHDWNKSSYGKPAGILGINCGHTRYAFVPNVSIHRDKHINKAENDEAYQEKQMQRYYERTIRNKKREISMLKETGAEPVYIKQKQNQLNDYRKQYTSFLNDTGRTRITANEWIGKQNTSLYSNLTKASYKKTTKEIVDSARSIVSEKFELRTRGVSVLRENKKYSYYDAKANKIILGNNADEYTLIHELGHKLQTTFTKEEKKDYNNIINNKFSKYTKNDFKKVKKETGTYWVLKDSSEFVTEYQTRIYNSPFAFKRGKPNADYALEYLAEGIKYYYKQPSLLQSKDKNLYDFIEKVMK